jgi:hypothetical protein
MPKLELFLFKPVLDGPEVERLKVKRVRVERDPA